MAGFISERKAREAYLASYSPGWKGLRSITAMTVGQFLEWLEKGDTRKPLEGQVSRYAKGNPDQPRDSKGRWASTASVKSDVFDGEEGKNFRDKATAWAKRELVGKSFQNDDTQMEIRVNKRSITKTLSHLPDNKPGLALKALPDLLRDAVKVRSEPSRSDDQNVKGWHYLSADIEIDGLPHTTEIKVREDAVGNYYYDQHVLEKKAGSPYKLVASDQRSDVGPAGEPAEPSIDEESTEDKEKYARPRKPAAGQKELEWITIGGAAEDDKKLVGGTPVQADMQGRPRIEN